MKRERKMVAGVQAELQQLRTLEVERSSGPLSSSPLRSLRRFGGVASVEFSRPPRVGKPWWDTHACGAPTGVGRAWRPSGRRRRGCWRPRRKCGMRLPSSRRSAFQCLNACGFSAESCRVQRFGSLAPLVSSSRFRVRVIACCRKAVEMIEHRRDEVTASLDVWARGSPRVSAPSPRGRLRSQSAHRNDKR